MYTVTKNGIENLKNQLQIIHMSIYDNLTGLLNRNSYEANLSAYIDSCNEMIACIYIDANGLHELNNFYGHAAGDKMLQSVADLLKEMFGPEDSFRIGGDEFVAFANAFDDIDRLVSTAEKRMYEEKVRFYSEEGAYRSKRNRYELI